MTIGMIVISVLSFVYGLSVQGFMVLVISVSFLVRSIDSDREPLCISKR